MFFAHRVRPIYLLLALLLIPGWLLAAPAGTRITLPTRTLTPADDGGAWLLSRNSDRPAAALLQFRSHPDAGQRAALADDGITLEEYVGGGAWAAYITGAPNRAALDAADVRWAGELIAADRVHPYVAAGQAPDWAQTPEGRLYTVTFFKPVDELEALAVLEDAGADVGAELPTLNAWHVRGDDAMATALADDPRVLHVSFISPPLESLNAGVRGAMNVDPLHIAPYNLSGAGELVCVYDGGLVDTSHPDFGGRVQQGETGSLSAHSTHVAGTVAGNGDDTHRGVAPGANIVSMFYDACDPNCLYDSPNDIVDNYTLAYNTYGARVFTNSIGANIAPNGYPCDWLGDYEQTSAILDGLVRGDLGSPVILVWAAGNERGGSCGSSFATMSVPSGAKNLITVGASNDNDGITGFTSWGPTDDGRVKPDVMAPGNNVSSCNVGGGYTTMSGTSMATPGVAGVVALLLEAWHSWIDPTADPSPEQVKAILINTAEDLHNVGPDYAFGFGRVDAQRAIRSLQYPSYMEGVVEDEQLLSYTFTVPPNMPSIKVTMAWTDAPAGYLPEFTLVNNLNMALRDPSGTNHMAWMLDGDNPSAPATRGINNVDNVEQVEVDNPQAGEWTLYVQGADVPEGPQNFAISSSLPLGGNFSRVSGTVVRIGDGEPVEGVKISVDGDNGRELRAITDENGQYEAWVEILGDTRLYADAFGYLPQSGWITDNGTGAETMNFVFVPVTGVTVSGTVQDGDGNPVPGASITVAELPGVSATSQANGSYSLSLITGERLTLNAAQGNLMDSHQVFLQPNQDETVDFFLADEQYSVSGPDGHGYIAIQNGDNHPLAPEFDWVEIDPLAGGSGTRITIAGEETPVLVDLPFSFGYYGEVYDQLTVNENGMFGFGDLTSMDPDTAADYSNTSLPGPDGPPAMVAPFWEDFYAAETNLSTYDDGAGRFYIEWYESRQYVPDTAFETFQVILYDPAVFPTGSSDGSIKFQYLEVTDIGNATVGIEDHTETVALQLGYFDNEGSGEWGSTVVPVASNSAVLFARPVANVTGSVTLNPPAPGVDVLVTLAGETMQASNDGNFLFEMVPLGMQVLELRADGYEAIQQGVELLGGPVVVPPLVLSRLDPPMEVMFTELEGDPSSGATISWDYTPAETDDFLGAFRVYRDGMGIAQTQELSYDDPTPLQPDRRYWVTALYAGGESDSSMHAIFVSDVGETEAVLPREFEVSAAWPNPFNPSTTVKVALPEAAVLKVAVYDILGRRVALLADGARRSAGYHRLQWDATGHASGVYFLRVDAGPHQAVRKLMLLK